jgi:hypothetical protein
MNKLKERWGITSNFQIFIILLVFSITGSTSLYVSRPLIKWLNIHPERFSPVLYWILYILVSLVAYQFLLLFFGWIFGQFHFFHGIVKKMLRRLRILKKE